MASSLTPLTPPRSIAIDSEHLAEDEVGLCGSKTGMYTILSAITHH
jgi:hypothetical protein